MSGKNQKGKPCETDLPYLKTISQVLNWHQNIEYIADTCNVLKTQTTKYGDKKGRAK